MKIVARLLIPYMLAISTLSAECGDPTIIVQANMPYTISQSGSYCLGESVNGEITIDANNVVLDLQNHYISSGTFNISVSNHSDIIIMNGIVQQAANTGIFIDTCTQVNIFDIDFINNGTGIYALTTTEILVHSCTFREHTNFPIYFVDTHQTTINQSEFINNYGITEIGLQDGNNVVCNNLSINHNSKNYPDLEFTADIYGLRLIDSIIKHCYVNDNENISNGNHAAIIMNNCTNIIIAESTANSNRSNNLTAGILALLQPEQIVIENCQANNNQSTDSTGGILVSGGHNHCVINCKVLNNQGVNDCSGIQLEDTFDCTVRNNIAKNNSSNTNSLGISNNGSNSVFFANEAQGHANNLAGTMPKVTYDSSTGNFTIFGTSTPTQPTCYDNIDVQ